MNDNRIVSSCRKGSAMKVSRLTGDSFETTAWRNHVHGFLYFLFTKHDYAKLRITINAYLILDKSNYDDIS